VRRPSQAPGGSPWGGGLAPLLAVLTLLGSCSSSCSGSGRTRGAGGADARERCPAEEPALPALPFEKPLHRLAEFWLDPSRGLEAIAVSKERIELANARVAGLRDEAGELALRHSPGQLRFEERRVRARLERSLDKLARAVAEGKRTTARGGSAEPLLEAVRREVESSKPANELRLVHTSTPLRCYPTDERLLESADQPLFDLAQCAQLGLGEPLRVLRKGARFFYVISSYAEGWVSPLALSPPTQAAPASTDAAPAAVVGVDRLALFEDPSAHKLVGVARLGDRLPVVQTDEGGALGVSVPTAAGTGRAFVLDPRKIHLGPPPLTRAALLTTAFDLLDSPYGWGGAGGNRDCSQFFMDLFSVFGVFLPRNSLHQAQAGHRRVEVAGLSDEAKTRAIETAAVRGIVLLYLPGHIMLFLGRDDGHLYALHQFSGYLRPCAGGGETMVRVNRAAVTSLELGRGSSRRSFLERITRLVVFE
jgi:hypothetical protein